MKEFYTEEPMSFKGILRKNYLRAHLGSPLKKMRYNTAEQEYKRILEEVIKLYTQLPDPISKKVYERNRRDDRTCLESMHSFLTPSFLFNLSCDFDCNCVITYGFHDCPFENEIKKMLLESCWSCMKEFNNISGFQTYYKNVMRMQDQEYIRIL